MPLLQTLLLQINANKFICDREAKALGLKGPVDFIEGEDGCDKRIEEYMKNKAHIAESSGDKKAFDVCIMNPPFNSGMHLKVLEKVVKYAEETINISPITELQKKLLYGRDWKVNLPPFEIIEVFDYRNNKDVFGIILKNDLGIIKFSKDVKYDEARLKERLFGRDLSIIEKIANKAKVENLKSHLENKTNSKYYLKFGSSCPTMLGLKIDHSSFRICSGNFKTATTDYGKGHTVFLNLENEEQQKNIWSFYNSDVMRWYNWKGELKGTRYYETPYPDPNKNFTEEDLYEYFDLTEDEIAIIKEDAELFHR